MDENQKTEAVKSLTDSELFQVIYTQDIFLSSLPETDLEDYKAQNSHYRLKNDFTSLEYFGVKHSYDPNNPQFHNIETAFNSFIEGKDINKVTVLVEGNIPATRPNIQDDIHFSGERGFITHLAKNIGIEVKCLEPDIKSEVAYLLTKFQPSEIEYYYYLRAIRDYFRLGRIQDGTTFEEYSKQLLENHKKLYGGIEEFSDFDFSLENIKQIHKNMLGSDFDMNKRPDIDPRSTASVLNTISKASSTYRDFYHVRNIEKELKEGYMVFVVNGRDHSVTQKPALECILS